MEHSGVGASSKRANVGRVGLLVFALFEDASALFRYPQVSFASLSSPAVMDLRRLRRRLGWAAGVRPLRGRFSLVSLSAGFDRFALFTRGYRPSPPSATFALDCCFIPLMLG